MKSLRHTLSEAVSRRGNSHLELEDINIGKTYLKDFTDILDSMGYMEVDVDSMLDERDNSIYRYRYVGNNINIVVRNKNHENYIRLSFDKHTERLKYAVSIGLDLRTSDRLYIEEIIDYIRNP